MADRLCQGNHARSQGGGIFVSPAQGDLTRNRILGNDASTGGGIMIRGSWPITVSNNLIAQNLATARGGGLCANYPSPPSPQVLLVNNTLADNEQAGVATWRSVGPRRLRGGLGLALDRRAGRLEWDGGRSANQPTHTLDPAN